MSRSGNDRHDEILDDAVRSGVTGHNVRYVLAAGLTGVVTAFAAIAIYFGYDTLQARMDAVLSKSPTQLVRDIAPYAAMLAIGAIAIALLLGIWSLIAGRDDSASQTGMRLRVVGQFVIVCIIMTMLYLSSN